MTRNMDERYGRDLTGSTESTEKARRIIRQRGTPAGGRDVEERAETVAVKDGTAYVVGSSKVKRIRDGDHLNLGE